MFSVPTTLGYPALFGLIFAESAGIPVPGETALLTAGVLAGVGHLALPAVVATAVGAAVLGDTLGYWLGRRGGRMVLLRHGPFKAARREALEHGERFFARHGAKTVFLGRFVPGVRVMAAVVAGATAMPWRRFAIYNFAGACAWATIVAGLASLVGPTVATGFGAVAIAVGIVGAIVVLWRAMRRRRRRPASPSLAPEAGR